VAKVFVNIFSTKYYFANYLEIILAGAKFGTLCCVIIRSCAASYIKNYNLLDLKHESGAGVDLEDIVVVNANLEGVEGE